jgi:hypothetical protein
MDLDLIKSNGLDPAIRKHAWKFLLGIFDWGSDLTSQTLILESKRLEYNALKSAWSLNTNSDTLFCIQKDIVRTDRSLPFYNLNIEYSKFTPAEIIQMSPALQMLSNIVMTYVVREGHGFVQGMVDLASPLLYIMQDESDAYWCFESMMSKLNLAQNFWENGIAMSQKLSIIKTRLYELEPAIYKHFENINALDLFCCVRWMLVLFKREFEFEQLMKVWEFCFIDPKMVPLIAVAMFKCSNCLELQSSDELFLVVTEFNQA